MTAWLVMHTKRNTVTDVNVAIIFTRTGSNVSFFQLKT